MSEREIEITTVAGEQVKLPVSKIQYAWQKTLNAPEKSVTSIVYTEDETKEKGLCFSPAFPWGGDPLSPYFSGWVAVESPMSLDEFKDKLGSFDPPIRSFWFRRSNTNGDDRVIVRHPSTLLDAIYQYVLPLNDLSEEGDMRRKGLNSKISKVFGGGGSVIDVPLGLVYVSEDCGIQLIGHPIDIMAAFNVLNSSYMSPSPVV